MTLPLDTFLDLLLTRPTRGPAPAPPPIPESSPVHQVCRPRLSQEVAAAISSQ